MIATSSESIRGTPVENTKKARGAHKTEDAESRGLLNINADDWGRDRENTDRTLECVSRGTVNSVSAMVFMADSERAASIARENQVEAGLHLNFTTAFSAKDRPPKVQARQDELARFLRANRFAQVLFHPLLARSFEYLVSSQLDEYQRIYGEAPRRLDGHHHMHLCTNVLLGKLLPAGTLVRRSFTFQVGEKGRVNRFYRRLVDRLLASRHRTADCFFSLVPLNPIERLERIFKLSETLTVEVETHPVNTEEFKFLMGDEALRLSEKLRTAVLQKEQARAGQTELPELPA
jgi:predicted glycoside hydrolase/deacetylase ChbG (UPF0249 family)